MRDSAGRGNLSTVAVHAGERSGGGEWKPVATPIHPSVTYVYEHMDDLNAVFGDPGAGFVYGRHGSPTERAFERAMAEMENGDVALAFASGMAALHAALLASGVTNGACVLAAVDLYGATHALLKRLFADQGVDVAVTDVTDPVAVEGALSTRRPVAVLVETISNPLLKVTDMPRLVALCRRFRAKLLVDNTFATPVLVNPLAMGADFCIHSATKYIGGHGDVMAGVVVAQAEGGPRLDEVRRLAGGTLSPFAAWLALRGLKTLPLRVDRQCRNALNIATWLESRKEVERVNYPGLASHPQHELAQTLFAGSGYGGVLSFELANADGRAVFKFMDALRLCLPATSLGDVFSLVLHPATASHRSLSGEERERMGIRDNLVRLSAGIEDVDDIKADLAQALATIGVR